MKIKNVIVRVVMRVDYEFQYSYDITVRVVRRVKIRFQYITDGWLGHKHNVYTTSVPAEGLSYNAGDWLIKLCNARPSIIGIHQNYIVKYAKVQYCTCCI